MRLTLNAFLTPGGVMQAPGRRGEDPSGGSSHGGWSSPRGDQGLAAAMAGWFASSADLPVGQNSPASEQM